MIPRLARGFKFRHDAVRDRWVVLGPERAFVPDPVGAEVIKLIDGVRSIEEIVDRLAQDFNAPRLVIETDVAALIEDLIGRGVISTDLKS